MATRNLTPANSDTVSRDELCALFGEDSPVVDQLEGKTETQVDQFVTDAIWLQSLQPGAFETLATLLALHERDPDRFDSLMADWKAGNLTCAEVLEMAA